jgi:L-threonylcarbamoyladenylate synthase
VREAVNTPSRLQLDLACHALAAGGVIAYPTEAVWGLGCEPLNHHACTRILALKRRPRAKGFILIASDFPQLRRFVREMPRRQLAPALDSWPGAATWLVPAASWVPDYLTGGRDTLALRVTAHPVARALCAAYGGPIVSTSANVSGHAPARSALQVHRQFRGGLDYVVPAATGGLARPTPIRDLASGAVVRA